MIRLQRYIAKEIAVTWLAVTFVLVVVLMTHRMVQLLAHVASGDFSGDVVFILLGLKALAFLPVILPFTLFLAQLLVLGRLSRDNELTVMYSCGVTPRFMFHAIALIAVPLILIVGFMALWVSPWAETEGWKTRNIAEQEGPLATIEPGRFVEMNGQRLVIYVAGKDSKTGEMSQVFVHAKGKEDDKDVIISSQTAQLTEPEDDLVRYIEFRDGVRYEGTPGNPQWRYIEFNTHGLKLDSPVEMGEANKIACKTTSDLLTNRSAKALAEFNWRVGLPVMILLLSILSLPLGHAGPREGRFGRLLYGVLIYLFYLNGLVLGRKFIEDGKIPAMLGMWWIHFIVLVVAIWLYRRTYGIRRQHKQGCHTRGANEAA